ncbi:Epithelial sodium channel [Cinara cedri]|uniref:Epithelial sodium channel n=1 Tax=Cinara cedri TaxID=506608 RepID=A0A5E4N343_9HEMI|nr:Epithelial sodium channel [Cinara cedri]
MSLKMIWVDYCKNGSIHGLRHVIQKDRKPCERFMWILSVVVASITLVVLLSASWEKYSYSPMKIVVDDPRYPLAKIDFPAVTICPINKIMYSKALKLVLNKYSNNADLRTKWSNSLQTLGRIQYPHNTDLYYFTKNKSTIDIPLKDISHLMFELAPTIDDMFFKCFWRGTMYKCADILRFQRTEEGFCYSFNSKTAERSKNDSEINPPLARLDGTLIPLRNNAASKGTGLKVILNDMNEEFFPGDSRRRGFNVIVHNPEAFPDVSTSYKLHAVHDQINRISVSVAQVKADDSLGRLSDHDRRCFMYESTNGPSSNEDMCYSECRLTTVYKACNCTQYFFKPFKGIASHCGIQHVPCLIENDVIQRNPQAPDNEPGFPKWSVPVSMNCSCPPPCSFITYTTEIQQEMRHPININPSTTLMYKVILEVNYRELFATSYQRSMKYTTQDLLVSFGGMASLFLGCSLVSVVEILYVVYKTLLVLKQNYINFNMNKVNTIKTEKYQQYPFVY